MNDAISFTPAPESLPGLPAHGIGSDQSAPLPAFAPEPPPQHILPKSHPDLPPEHANYPSHR
jgi:hypothetical protein